MRVFLDTNVLLSAFLTRGLCTSVLLAVLEHHQLITSELVVDEFERAMRGKFRMPPELVADYRRFVQRYVAASEALRVTGLGLDASDSLVLGSALANAADVLITGDKLILACSDSVREIRIMSPREFWIKVVMAERS